MYKLDYKEVQEIINLSERCYYKLDKGDFGLFSSGLELTETEVSLRKQIKNLGEQKIIELCALVWLGSTESDENWHSLISIATNEYHEGTINYIADKKPLAKYLRDGWRRLYEL